MIQMRLQLEVQKKTGSAYFVVNARIYSGERGKGGGIKIA